MRLGVRASLVLENMMTSIWGTTCPCGIIQQILGKWNIINRGTFPSYYIKMATQHAQEWITRVYCSREGGKMRDNQVTFTLP